MAAGMLNGAAQICQFQMKKVRNARRELDRPVVCRDCAAVDVPRLALRPDLRLDRPRSLDRQHCACAPRVSARCGLARRNSTLVRGVGSAGSLCAAHPWRRAWAQSDRNGISRTPTKTCACTMGQSPVRHPARFGERSDLGGDPGHTAACHSAADGTTRGKPHKSACWTFGWAYRARGSSAHADLRRCNQPNPHHAHDPPRLRRNRPAAVYRSRGATSAGSRSRNVAADQPRARADRPGTTRGGCGADGSCAEPFRRYAEAGLLCAYLARRTFTL